MKNIIIAGASRSGKSTVAKQIAKTYNMSYIPFDSIVSTMENNYPEVGIKHLDDNLKMSVKIAGFLEEFIKHLEYEDINYIIDLYQVYPNDLATFIDPNTHLVVYFGYPFIQAEEKLKYIKQYAREQDWTRNTPDQEMIEILQLFLAENKMMYHQCKKQGYKFFDTGSEFMEVIEQSKHYIHSNI